MSQKNKALIWFCWQKLAIIFYRFEKILTFSNFLQTLFVIYFTPKKKFFLKRKTKNFFYKALSIRWSWVMVRKYVHGFTYFLFPNFYTVLTYSNLQNIFQNNQNPSTFDHRFFDQQAPYSNPYKVLSKNFCTILSHYIFYYSHEVFKKISENLTKIM